MCVRVCKSTHTEAHTHVAVFDDSCYTRGQAIDPEGRPLRANAQRCLFTLSTSLETVRLVTSALCLARVCLFVYRLAGWGESLEIS